MYSQTELIYHAIKSTAEQVIAPAIVANGVLVGIAWVLIYFSVNVTFVLRLFVWV